MTAEHVAPMAESWRDSPLTAYLATRAHALHPLEFVAVAVPEPPFDAVRLVRDDQGVLGVEVSAREGEPFSPDQVAALGGLGFVEGTEAWVLTPAPADVDAAVDRVGWVLSRVFGVTGDAALDVRHGSDRAEFESRRKLAQMRSMIEPVLAEVLGQPAPTDPDGDYLVDIGPHRVFVAPRAIPGSPAIIRVFTITNTSLVPTPELGLFLSRLNFTVMFGRFSLDVESRSVWFDETLLGDQVTAEELRFTVQLVGSTAADWATRIAKTFGGGIPQPPQPEQAGPASKPGQGGYL